MNSKKIMINIILSFCLTACGHLFYMPHQEIYNTPDKFHVKYEENIYFSCDKVPLKAWVLKSSDKNKKGTILHFHGNAENRSTHFFQLAWLTLKGFDIIIFDYRGYGDSGGKASREGIYHDAHTMIERAYEYHLAQNNQKFIVWGQSLGGNIAARGAFEFKDKIDVLVLDSTFSSYQDIGFDKLKSFPLTFLLSPLAYVLVNDDKSAKKVIDQLKTSTIVIHSKEDKVIPYKFGEEIFQRLSSKKKMISFDKVNHLEAFRFERNRDLFLEEYEKFIKDL